MKNNVCLPSGKITLEDFEQRTAAPPVLQDGLSFIRLGVESILQDDFTECFLRHTNESVNAKAILKDAAYCVGWCIRYFLLFPYRFFHLISASLTFFLILPFIIKFNNQPWKSRIFTYYCRAFLYSWGSRIKYHGKKARLNVPHIFVSNHTSFIDYVVLSANSFVHSTIAQKHGGIIGWFETFVLTLVGSLIFDRTSPYERRDVIPNISRHISDKKCAPLLVFPEGTCVNNEYTVLFHKGIFELDCVIVPVAIKYNKQWADAYWHTRTQTFTKHLFYLMTRWALIADVWYLPPQTKKPGQTASEFAAYIKSQISNVAGLKNLSWDGYYKHFVLLKNKQATLRASPQSTYVNSLLKRIDSKFYSPLSRKKSIFPLPDNTKLLNVSEPLLPNNEPTQILNPPSSPPPLTSKELTSLLDSSPFDSPDNAQLSTPRDSTGYRNSFLVEMADMCNISVIASCFSQHAGMLSAVESFPNDKSVIHYSKLRTDNIAERLWFKKHLEHYHRIQHTKESLSS